MMKTKFFVIFAAFLFAAITAYNLQLAQTQNLGDISLADITVMAQAQGENPGGGSYQGMGYCTAWKMDFKCRESGTSPCTCDCCNT